MQPSDVTDAMAVAAWDAYSPEDSLSDMRKAIAAAINASGCVLVPANTVSLVMECRDALAEELAAWDIDPPLHHVKQAHDRCEEWLAAAAPQPGKEKGDE